MYSEENARENIAQTHALKSIMRMSGSPTTFGLLETRKRSVTIFSLLKSKNRSRAPTAAKHARSS